MFVDFACSGGVSGTIFLEHVWKHLYTLAKHVAALSVPMLAQVTERAFTRVKSSSSFLIGGECEGGGAAAWV